MHFEDFAVLAYQEGGAPRCLVLLVEQPVLFGGVAAPIAEQREADADLVGPSLVRERRVHAHTQNLGV
jgi:hypothetical protein